MSKYYGKIGFVKTVETSPGVWEEVRTEKSYYGDVHRFTRKWDRSEKVNDDIDINIEISIIANPYAYENLGYMRYISWHKNYWEINSVEGDEYPRITLSIGGLYNGETGSSSSDSSQHAWQ